MAGPASHVFKVEIAAPIRQVWDLITRTGVVQRPMFDTVLEAELKPGGRMRYVTKNGKHTFIVGEVVEVRPPTKFVHTFAWKDLTEPATLVTWDLVERGGRVSVTVTHEKLDVAPETAKRITGGWPTILGNLKSMAERGNLSLKMRLMFAMMKVALVFKPAKG